MNNIRFERNVSIENIPEEAVRQKIEHFLKRPCTELIEIEKYELSGATTYNIYIQSGLSFYKIKIPACKPASFQSECIDVDLIAKLLSCQGLREKLHEMYGISIIHN